MSWITRLLGLDAWKESALSEISSAKEAALLETATDWIDRHLHELRPGSMYVVHVSENTSRASCDAMREAIEGCGAYAILVAADTMRVISFSAKA